MKDRSIKLCWMERNRSILLGNKIIPYAMYLIQSMSNMSNLCFLVSIDANVIMAMRHYAKIFRKIPTTCHVEQCTKSF